MTLHAFHNNIQTQQMFWKRTKNHYDADELIHGAYWENGKGCALGCMTHSGNHQDLESLFGIPEWLGRLVDTLFEGMDHKYSKEFYFNFIKTVSKQSFLGFDNWQHIYHQLCLHILEKECKNIEHPLVKQVICDIITLHKTEETDKEKWSAAGSAAESAARSAWSARSAESARSAAWSARSAAWSARSARSARSAAESAARSARSAESAAYKSIANKLIELLKVEYENSR